MAAHRAAHDVNADRGAAHRVRGAFLRALDRHGEAPGPASGVHGPTGGVHATRPEREERILCSGDEWNVGG
jgi:hypothetical protein